MTLLQSILVIATAGALTFPSQPPQPKTAHVGRHRAVTPITSPAPAPSSPQFKADQVEFYLSDDGIAYIRPGLKVKVNSVTIGQDRKVVVDFNLTDGLDQPIDRLGKVTPGPVTMGFLIAWYNPDIRQYVNYVVRTVTAPANSPRPGAQATQAGADSGGKYVDLELGHSTYTFGTALPANFDVTKTHTLGIYANRNLNDIIGKTYLLSYEQDFRPDGQPVTETWDKINLAASCNNCHDPLTAHGSTGRKDPKLCAMCHQPQTTDPDTGNTVDFKVMIHKIHDGANLPSVIAGTPYQIIGFGQGVNDFSTVEFPQDIKNCQNCHEGTDSAHKPTQFDVYMTHPGRAACGSCHDDINWDTGLGHPGGAQADDSACASCHIPDSGAEFDASVKGAHTVTYKSKQLAGLTTSIVSVTNFAPGQSPTVAIAVKSGDGTPVDGSKLNSFSPMFAGPTTSYTTYVREAAVGKAVFDAASGNTVYTFTGKLPADASGTWAVTVDARRSVTLTRADGKDPITNVREGAFNPIKYIAITGDVTPRRAVVAIAQCNTCHDRLALHGGQRLNTQECVICHNPTNNDGATPVAESISFNRMIHRIHTGEDLTQNYSIRSASFNEVRFPGDRRNCAKCHVGTSYTLPLPTGIDPVITLKDYFTPQGPGTASCLGCHDNRDAAAHAYLNTAMFGGTTPAEACATCHGTGADWDVAKVHAR